MTIDTIALNQAKQTSDICFPLKVGSIHGLTIGDPSKPLVLCLHGWLDNAASFLPLMSELSDKQFSDKYIVAIDWPGHGFSDHRGADAHYHFIDWIADLAQLFELKQWHNIDIVAHSMGGMIATAFAAAFPEKVKSLTLIDSIGFLCAEPEKTTEQLRDGILSRLKLLGVNSSHSNKKKGLHGTIDSAIKARVNVSDLAYQHAQLIVERGIANNSDGFTWRSDSRLRLKSPYRFSPEQGKQLVRDIQCPVQLVYGDKGLDLVGKGVELFQPLFKQFSSFELIGGHHVHMEQPKALAELISTFLEKS